MASVSWPGHLRNHPRLWSEDDGKVVLAALEERYNAIIAENAVQDVLSLQLEGGDEDVIKGYEGGKKHILVNHYSDWGNTASFLQSLPLPLFLSQLTATMVRAITSA